MSQRCERRSIAYVHQAGFKPTNERLAALLYNVSLHEGLHKMLEMMCDMILCIKCKNKCTGLQSDIKPENFAFQLRGEHTVLQPFRRIEFIILIFILNVIAVQHFQVLICTRVKRSM